ncbi:hypothetical protein NLX62_07090, partial [Mycobacteriaceae bacterium Msp059]|nr:hypothetical protein [Mycobacteriaceae bacterium Msp059]
MTHHVNSYKSCGSDTTDPGTVVAPPPTRTPSLGPTPSSPSAPPTYTIPTTPVRKDSVDPSTSNPWIPLLVLCALAGAAGLA